MSRRNVISLVASSAFLVLASARPANGARGWCRSDPLVSIDDQLVYVVYSAPQAIRKATTGPTDVVISIPDDVTAKLIAPGPAFGEGESVRFVSSSALKKGGADIQIMVEVRVPAREDLPVNLECAHRLRANRHSPATVDGLTNTWLALFNIVEGDDDRRDSSR